MKRARSLVLALAALALTAGLAWAHAMPAASDGGLSTAQDVSGKVVPMANDASNGNTDEPISQSSAAPTDTHGATVSAAATSPTPDGFDNHGAYVSSIAKGWGQQTAAAHQNPAANGSLPDHAQGGLSHRP